MSLSAFSALGNAQTHEQAAHKNEIKELRVTAGGVGALDETQQHAINTILQNKYTVVVGQAGTGKTHVLTQGIKELLAQAGTWDPLSHATMGRHFCGPRPAVAFLAWTNAVVGNFIKRLPKELTQNCMTIHKFLGYAPAMPEDYDGETVKWKFEPRYTSYNKHSADIIVIDEISTVPASLIYEILDASPSHVRIIALGDINQLEPVGGVSLMPYMMHSWPTVALTKIYRQGAGSPIIENADNIIHGRPLVSSEEFFVSGNSHENHVQFPMDVNEAGMMLYRRLNKDLRAGIYDPRLDQVLTAVNEGPLGVETINKVIAALINDGTVGNRSRVPVTVTYANSHRDFRIGDRVRAIASPGGKINGMPTGMEAYVVGIRPLNDVEMPAVDFDELDADLFTELPSDAELATNVVEELDHEKMASHEVTLMMPETGSTLKISKASEFRALIFGWASTVHRAQGLQFRRVYMVTHSSFSSMINREWAYTGVTRAISGVVFFHTRLSLEAVKTNKRYLGSTPMEKAANRIRETSARGIEYKLPANAQVSS